VTNPGPASLATGFDNLGVVLEHIRVDNRGGADAMAIEQLHQPPDADAWPVVTPSVVERVRDKLRGELSEAERRLPVEVVLDVERDPHREALGIWELQLRAGGDWHIVVKRRLHVDLLTGTSCWRLPHEGLEAGYERRSSPWS